MESASFARNGSSDKESPDGGGNIDLFETGTSLTLAQLGVLDLQVGAGTDDWYSNAAAFDNLSSFWSFGKFTGGEIRDGGARFTNVTIPRGATITAATMTLNAFSSRSEISANVIIRLEDADSPAAPTSEADWNGRTFTSALESWTVPATTAGVDFTTPDFISAMQEVVDRPGWTSGNAMIIAIHDNGASTSARRDGESYESTPADAARLHIEYITQ